MEQYIAILVLILLGFVCFAIYFIFKMLQFVIQAINLYKDIVTRQDAIIKLLLDIRDGTAALDPADLPQEPKRPATESLEDRSLPRVEDASSTLVAKFEDRPSEKLREMLGAPAGTYNPDVLASAQKVLDSRGESVQ